MLKRAFGALARHPGLRLMAIVSIAMGLLLLGTVRLASRNVAAATESWGEGVQMVVYLEDGVGVARAGEIERALAKLPAVAATQYIAPERALSRLRDSLGEHDDLAAGIEQGMLPGSIEVHLHPGIKDVAQGHPVMARLESVAGVEQVEFLGEWVERLSALERALAYAGWFLTLLVGFACVFLIATTLRLSIGRRREEVEILEMLGASSGFVRGPILLEGLIQGAVGALLSVVALWSLYRLTSGAVADALSRAFGAVDLSFLPATELVYIVALGAGVGLAGSWLATGQRELARS